MIPKQQKLQDSTHLAANLTYKKTNKKEYLPPIEIRRHIGYNKFCSFLNNE